MLRISILCLLLCISGLASANMRAPVHIFEGYGAQLNAPVKSLVVDHETLEYVCQTQPNVLSVSSCSVTAVYSIQSLDKLERSYQFTFLLPKPAYQTHSPTIFSVSINKSQTAVSEDSATVNSDLLLFKALQEFNDQINLIRASWNNEREYITAENFERMNPVLDSMNDMKIAEDLLPDSIRIPLSQYRTNLKGLSVSGVEHKNEPDFNPVEELLTIQKAVTEFETQLRSRAAILDQFPFQGTLHEGMNQIRIQFTQTLSVNEVSGPSYFANSDFVTYADYLFQPLKTWSLADNFYLDLDVRIKSDKSWFGKLFDMRQIVVQTCDEVSKIPVGKGISIPECKTELSSTHDNGSSHRIFRFGKNFPDYIRILFGREKDIKRF